MEPEIPKQGQRPTQTAPPPNIPRESQSSFVPTSTTAASPSSGPSPDTVVTLPQPSPDKAVAVEVHPLQFSPQTEEIVRRVNTSVAGAAQAGTPVWNAAKEQVMKDMAMSEKISPPEREATLPKRGGRGRKRTSFVRGESASVGEETELHASSVIPGSSGRGRGGGRPRGRGRGGGRGTKRKREGRDDGDTDSSEEITTPVISMTKSGRSVQKPTSFVPPQPTSPAPTNKRKRTYRKNPDSAVCKACLRGTSPAGNMIVFCDGCNTPYHRYCHNPPIDQSVVDKLDKEWYCKHCEKEQVVPVPEEQITNFVAAHGASAEQRQHYFASQPQGLLVTLLTKATTLQPDLPLFSPNFQMSISSISGGVGLSVPGQTLENGDGHPVVTSVNIPATTPTASSMHSRIATATTTAPSREAKQLADNTISDVNDSYVDHPQTYPRPGQGLMKTLPPEQEDLRWLVEEDSKFGAFNHMYQVDARAANNGLNGNV